MLSAEQPIIENKTFKEDKMKTENLLLKTLNTVPFISTSKVTSLESFKILKAEFNKI